MSSFNAYSGASTLLVVQEGKESKKKDCATYDERSMDCSRNKDKKKY